MKWLKKMIKKVLVKYELHGLYRFLYAVYLFFVNQWVKLRLFKHKKYELKLNDHIIQFDVSDVYTKRWFYRFIKGNQIYEPALSTYIISNLKNADCFLDVGAHIGYFSCIAAHKCKQGSVHAFEIEEHCISYVQKNVQLNHFENVVINNIAVSDSNQSIKIVQKNNPNNKTNIFNKNGKLKSVKATTLDNYMKAQQIIPTIIKIDVEGAEVKVLRGMSNILKLPQLVLLIEVHGNILDYLGFKSDEIMEILLSNHFKLYELDDFRNGDSVKQPLPDNYQFTTNMLLVAEKGNRKQR